MLEELLPRWRGKVFVLILLGFALTDFVITMTLSAADAAAHIIENPYVPRFLNHPEAVTLMLLAALGAVFIRGFREAIGLAVAIVALYLVLNAVLLGACVRELALHHPGALTLWRLLVNQTFSSPLATIAVAFLLYPKLALGLSGFETGVAWSEIGRAHV